jgi:hypothetical protein
MKNLKNLMLGTFLLCLVTACSKEEPQNCNCNAPKPIKQSMKGKLFTNFEKNLEIERMLTIGVSRIIICNQSHVRNLLKQTIIDKDSIVRIEMNIADCNRNATNISNPAFFLIDVTAIQRDSIK